MNSWPSDARRQSGSSFALGASALLALILGEAGKDTVFDAITQGAVISPVNHAEVVSKLLELTFTEPQIQASLRPLYIPVLPFDEVQAWHVGQLRLSTRQRGLSLGDRACLSLGAALGIPVLTAERIWQELDVGVEVVLCR